MAASSRINPKSTLVLVIGGLVAAVLVIGAYLLATGAQDDDTPRTSGVEVRLPERPPLPDAPKLPDAPIPRPQ